MASATEALTRCLVATLPENLAHIRPGDLYHHWQVPTERRYCCCRGCLQGQIVSSDFVIVGIHDVGICGLTKTAILDGVRGVAHRCRICGGGKPRYIDALPFEAVASAAHVAARTTVARVGLKIDAEVPALIIVADTGRTAAMSLVRACAPTAAAIAAVILYVGRADTLAAFTFVMQARVAFIVAAAAVVVIVSGVGQALPVTQRMTVVTVGITPLRIGLLESVGAEVGCHNPGVERRSTFAGSSPDGKPNPGVLGADAAVQTIIECRVASFPAARFAIVVGAFLAGVPSVAIIEAIVV